jgi:hypothetical protein
VDFYYDDTSGEVRDQRAEHEVRLAVFMNALEDYLYQNSQTLTHPA